MTKTLTTGALVAVLLTAATVWAQEPPSMKMTTEVPEGIATPDKLQFAVGLPKTRSGKIMRRILRKIAEGEGDKIGDVTTLADPSVVDALVQGRG